MYELISEQTENRKKVRTYINRQTSTTVKTTPIYTDSNGVIWWGFIDLFKVPYIRQAYAKHISDTFTMGLSLKDILEWCEQEKELLKGSDPEKYEKLYSLVLQKENLARHTADPIQKHLALCTIYVLSEDEQIDHFTDEQAAQKMKLWKADIRATAFFLTWHNEATQSFMKRFEKTLKTVSNPGRL